jgi:hypothetical protein
VTAAEAPIAFIERGRRFDISTDKDVSFTNQFRWYGGLLFNLAHDSILDDVTPCTLEEFQSDPFPFSLAGGNGNARNCEADVRQSLLDAAECILFIAGLKWKQVEEPRFVIRTFGMGHNHGGTSLDVEPDNSDYSFRPDQREEAIAEFIDVATGRGDTKALSAEIIHSVSTFEVLIPEVVTGPIIQPMGKFTITISVYVEGRGPKLALRRAVSRLRIPDHEAKNLTFAVTDQTTGETSRMEYD